MPLMSLAIPWRSVFGEVDRLAVLDLEQVALHHELAVSAGVQHAAALQLDFIQAVERAAGHAFHGHFQLEVLQRFTDGLLGTGVAIGCRGNGKGTGQRQRGGGENWVTRMGTPEGGQGPEGATCGKYAVTVRPLVQTAQAYHITLPVKGSQGPVGGT